MPKALKVPKQKGEEIRKFLKDHKKLDLDYKINRDEKNIYLPLKKDLSKKEKDQINQKSPGSKIIQQKRFEEKKQTPDNLEEALKYKLSEEELEKVPSSFDVLGDIAVVELPQALFDKKELIGKALMKVHKNLNTVLLQKSPVTGEYRVRDLEVIAGEQNTHTIHKEYGCRYKIDLSKVFFSPRLSHEREKVMNQVKPKEVIFDMFAGVGPFSILIAKKKDPKKVYAVDKNKESVRLLKKNLELNKVKDKVEPIHGDIRDITPKYKNSSDRAIMNLPFKSGSFLDEAITLLKEKGGIIHYYDIREEENLYEDAVEKISQKANKNGYSTRVLDKRIVRSYSPKVWNIAIDVELS
ncbi:class I SAM-dependent methyltransferase family protein [archaeon SCG-AAA382B04]|nr:class I SAM-dependent methyltransferase family protein [archaeon SCG-AAA382B04]